MSFEIIILKLVPFLPGADEFKIAMAHKAWQVGVAIVGLYDDGSPGK